VEPGVHTPLVSCFRRGDVPRDVKLLAARGAVAPRAHEQLALLLLLLDDADEEVAVAARLTLEVLPRRPLIAFLARADVPGEMRAYFTARGIVGEGGAGSDDPIVDVAEDLDPGEVEGSDQPGEEAAAAPKKRLLSSLSVVERIKVAMRGTREQRAILIRDTNRIVAAAVLSSPKLTDTDVEAFARMTSVSEEVLRVIGTSRGWLKHYAVASALVRNPKTPPAVALPLVTRLNERDLKNLSMDRNVQEGLRVVARKMLLTNQSRRR
jgi:hypothetical protein